MPEQFCKIFRTSAPYGGVSIPKLLGGYVSPITNPLGPVFIH